MALHCLCSSTHPFHLKLLVTMIPCSSGISISISIVPLQYPCLEYLPLIHLLRQLIIFLSTLNLRFLMIWKPTSNLELKPQLQTLPSHRYCPSEFKLHIAKHHIVLVATLHSTNGYFNLSAFFSNPYHISLCSQQKTLLLLHRENRSLHTLLAPQQVVHPVSASQSLWGFCCQPP